MLKLSKSNWVRIIYFSGFFTLNIYSLCSNSKTIEGKSFSYLRENIFHLQNYCFFGSASVTYFCVININVKIYEFVNNVSSFNDLLNSSFKFGYFIFTQNYFLGNKKFSHNKSSHSLRFIYYLIKRHKVGTLPVDSIIFFSHQKLLSRQ